MRKIVSQFIWGSMVEILWLFRSRFPTKIDSLLGEKFKVWNYTKKFGKSWSQNEEIPECKYKVTLHKKAVREDRQFMRQWVLQMGGPK